MGVLVAGADPVAVDATCCRLMRIDPMRIGYLRLRPAIRLYLPKAMCDKPANRSRRWRSRLRYTRIPRPAAGEWRMTFGGGGCGLGGLARPLQGPRPLGRGRRGATIQSLAAAHRSSHFAGLDADRHVAGQAIVRHSPRGQAIANSHQKTYRRRSHVLNMFLVSQGTAAYVATELYAGGEQPAALGPGGGHPIFALLILLGVARKPAWIASLVGLGTAALVAAGVYGMPLGRLFAAVAYGAAFGSSRLAGWCSPPFCFTA